MMAHGPWDDWLPGVLSKKQVLDLVGRDFILNASSDRNDFDYSAFDLRIADEAYELVGGCVKPFENGYLSELKSQKLVQKYEPRADGSYFLKARQSYLFRIRERIPALKGHCIYGSATAKSSIGRMDVLARLIVEGMDEYEGFRPARLFTGEMLLEVTPMTFNVCVRPDTSLTQLRLFKGPKEDSLIRGETVLDTVFQNHHPGSDATLSVDLSPDNVSGQKVSVFCATLQNAEDDTAIDLWSKPKEELAKPWDHWKFGFVDEFSRLRIEKDMFYIIRSREKIRLPAGVAVYCRASDETIGEMRIHYAGFVHPFFGNERTDGNRGTPLIFEVRGHDIDVSLRNHEKMARLEFYRMSQDAEQEDRKDDPYAGQTLKLSKFFAPWPEQASYATDGTVTPK